MTYNYKQGICILLKGRFTKVNEEKTDLTICNIFYLEFDPNEQFEHIIESTFVLLDDGSLTSKNNHSFASKHASLFFISIHHLKARARRLNSTFLSPTPIHVKKP